MFSNENVLSVDPADILTQNDPAYRQIDEALAGSKRKNEGVFPHIGTPGIPHDRVKFSYAANGSETLAPDFFESNTSGSSQFEDERLESPKKELFRFRGLRFKLGSLATVMGSGYFTYAGLHGEKPEVALVAGAICAGTLYGSQKSSRHKPK